MTNNEFLNSISKNAKNIIFNYQLKSNKNIIKVFLDNKSYVDYGYENMYIIYVNKNNPIDIMEYELLHKFYHCVQKDQGFPSATQKNIIYQKLAGYISSVVLDLDIIEHLDELGYKFDDNYLYRNIQNYKSLIEMSKFDKEAYKYLYNINEYVHICSMFAFCRLKCSNKNPINQLLQTLKITERTIYDSQEIIYNAIARYGYRTPKKALKTFKTIIRELELDSYIEIS